MPSGCGDSLKTEYSPMETSKKPKFVMPPTKGATHELREWLLNTVYDRSHLKAQSGYKLLAASNKLSQGIFIVEGNFARDGYKLALQEASAAGLSTKRVIVYGVTSTYSGQGIFFTKFEELGVTVPAVAYGAGPSQTIEPACAAA